MKSHVLAMAFAAILNSVSLFAQGTGSGMLSFNTTSVSDDKRIFVGSGGPGGGTRASGPNYQVALYWGPAGTTDDRNLVQVGPSVGFLTDGAAGTFFGGGRTINGLPVNGAVVSLQARAWCAAGGLFPSYEAALFGASPVGKGPVFDFKTKDPTDALEIPPTIGQAAGWRGFAIMNLGGGGDTCVPEPSTIALTILAAAILILTRRSIR